MYGFAAGAQVGLPATRTQRARTGNSSGFFLSCGSARVVMQIKLYECTVKCRMPRPSRRCTMHTSSAQSHARPHSHHHAGRSAAAALLAHPPFAMDRLRKEGAELVYRCAKQRSEPSDKRGTRADELHLAMRRADRSYCRPGAATAYAPAPLLWCAGPEFAAQGCGGGLCRADATGHG